MLEWDRFGTKYGQLAPKGDHAVPTKQPKITDFVPRKPRSVTTAVASKDAKRKHVSTSTELSTSTQLSDIEQSDSDAEDSASPRKSKNIQCREKKTREAKKRKRSKGSRRR